MSFFKKLFGEGNAPPTSIAVSGTSGVQSMHPNLQRRFARGIQYNMKLVIRGDRNVGKSTLLYRLQGGPFKEEYLPTDHIQVASISWSYKTTDDVVKVEVWDVVDKGRRTRRSDVPTTPPALKLSNTDKTPTTTATETFEPVLDAEFVDVYKGANGVIIVFDVTKPWTYAYVERELPRVPLSLPVLVVGNHRDMGHHRQVPDDKPRYYLESLHRPEDAAPVRYCELSLRNGFGLKYIYNFINLPYLLLQRESLQHQIETNKREFATAELELEAYEESDEANYDKYLASKQQMRRAEQDKLGSDALRKQQEAAAKAAAQLLASSPSPIAAHTSSLGGAPTGQRRILEAPPARPIPGLRLSAPAPAAPTSGASAAANQSAVLSPTAAATAAVAAAATGSSGKFGSKETLPTNATGAGSSSVDATATKSASSFTNSHSAPSQRPTASASSMGAANAKTQAIPSRNTPSPGSNSATQSLSKIDDFVPEEDSSPTALNDFLADSNAAAAAARVDSGAGGAQAAESDEEERAPVVLGYQEEVDSEDEKRLQNARSAIDNPFESGNTPAAGDAAYSSPDAPLGSERPFNSSSPSADSRERAHSFQNQDNPLVEREFDSPAAPAAASSSELSGDFGAPAPPLVFNAAELDLLESFGIPASTPAAAVAPQAQGNNSDSASNTQSESRGPSKKKHSSKKTQSATSPAAEAESDETPRERKHKHKNSSAPTADSAAEKETAGVKKERRPVDSNNNSSGSSKSSADRSRKQASAIAEESPPAPAKSRSVGGLKQSHEQPASTGSVGKRSGPAAGATSASGSGLTDEGELDALEAFLDDGASKPPAARPAATTKVSTGKIKKNSKRAQIRDSDNEKSD